MTVLLVVIVVAMAPLLLLLSLSLSLGSVPLALVTRRGRFGATRGAVLIRAFLLPSYCSGLQ